MEVAVGARTRTRSRSRPASADAKRRKAGGEFAKLSSTNSAAEEDRYYSSGRSDGDGDGDGEAPVSSCCCCSNGVSKLAEAEADRKRIGDDDRVSVSDLEVDESTEAETSTREMTPSSDLQESTAVPTEADSAAENIMPVDFELEEFFAAAEKGIQARFAEKYNYDIARDAPLEGRFEWVRLKP